MKFKLPIGDYSLDGHEIVEEFTVEGNYLPFEYVEAAHQEAKRITGVDIELICDDYQVNWVEPKVYEKLRTIGFLPDETELKNGKWYPSPLGMAKLWVYLLNYADARLGLSIVNDKLPSLNHQVGYGLFDVY